MGVGERRCLWQGIGFGDVTSDFIPPFDPRRYECRDFRYFAVEAFDLHKATVGNWALA